MARKTKTEEEGGESLALFGGGGSGSALADLIGGLDLPSNGLEEAEASDVRIAALVCNYKGTGPDGEPVPPNAFFDTVTETVSKRHRLAVIQWHKSNAWSEYNQAEGRTETKCRSWDRVHGTTDTGATRACKGCPDKQWSRDPKTGKPTRRCADVHNVVALDLDTGQPKVLRCKKTAERPWLDFLNRWFLGKLVINGERRAVPSFAYETELTAEMKSGGSHTYAVPRFDVKRGEDGEPIPFAVPDLRFFAESAAAYRELHLEAVRDVVDAVPDEDGASSSGAELDASFDPSDFVDDAPS